MILGRICAKSGENRVKSALSVPSASLTRVTNPKSPALLAADQQKIATVLSGLADKQPYRFGSPFQCQRTVKRGAL